MERRTFPSVKLTKGGTVFGVPGAHHRIVSAKAALVACESIKPKAIAVEVPSPVIPGIRRALDELYPTPCAICFNTSRGGEGYAFVVSPSDSITQVSRFAFSRGIPLFGVDLIVSGVGREQRDDTLPHGFDDWVWDAPITAPKELQPWSETWGRGKSAVDILREQFMAEELRRLACEFGIVLWVGGAAHWARIARLIAGEELSANERATPLVLGNDFEVEIACLEPVLALARFLDDLPNAAWQFHCATQESQEACKFDKWDAVDAIVREAIAHYASAFNGPSPRTTRQFQILLRKLLASEGLITPRPHHLFIAGRACLDEPFAKLLLEKAMNYPFPGLRSAHDGEKGYPMLTQADPDSHTLRPVPRNEGMADRPNSPSLILLNDSATPPHREQKPQTEETEAIRKEINRTARRALPQHGPYRWEDCIPEAHFCQQMHDRARQFAWESIRETDVASIPFARALSLGRGVDVRATIRSLACGEREVFVKTLIPSQSAVVDAFEPVVWDLKEPTKFSSPTFLWGWQDDSHDPVRPLYFAFFWGNHVYLKDDLIRRDWGTAVNFANLTSQARARELYRHSPERVPTRSIFNSPNPKNVVAQIGAAAVQYARQSVVWVSSSSQTIPPAVRASAAEKGKQIIHVNTALFAPTDLECLTYYHLWRSEDWESDEMAPPQHILETIDKYKRKQCARR